MTFFPVAVSRLRARSLPTSLCGELLSRRKMAEPPVPIKNLRLLDVKLGQLPTWIASLNYTPRAFLASCKRGHDRFYAKYWEPKRCGISGPAMLLTAYVVFSYYVVYDRLKEERWRKYH